MEFVGNVAAAVAALAALAALVMAFLTVRDGQRNHEAVMKQQQRALAEETRLRTIDQLERIADILESVADRQYNLPALNARLATALAALEALDGPQLEGTVSIARRGMRATEPVNDVVVNCLTEVKAALSALEVPRHGD